MASFLKTIGSRLYLRFTKQDQEKIFKALCKDFNGIYYGLQKYDIRSFIIPDWNAHSALIEKVFLPHPPLNFLRNKTIRDTMFVDAGGPWLEEELRYLEERFSRADLSALLQEDYVGGARIRILRYLASHNSVHHLYHLMRFSHETGENFNGMTRVVEWGGGYGNLAKILHRLKKDNLTYVIIDIPLLSCVQWLYLSSTLGSEKINLLRNPKDTIQQGKINLLPVCFLNTQKIEGDLFISTWALDESSQYAQDYVIQQQWFNSKHILLAFHDYTGLAPDSERIGMAAAAAGARIQKIDFIPDHQYYAFR